MNIYIIRYAGGAYLQFDNFEHAALRFIGDCRLGYDCILELDGNTIASVSDVGRSTNKN